MPIAIASEWDGPQDTVSFAQNEDPRSFSLSRICDRESCRGWHVLKTTNRFRMGWTLDLKSIPGEILLALKYKNRSSIL